MDKDNYRNTNEKKDSSSSNLNKGNSLDQYSKNINNVAGYEDEDEFLDEVNSSLAKQISMELEDKDTSTKDNGPKKKGKIPKGVKIFAIVFSVIMLLGCLLVFTPAGKKIIINLAGNYIYGKLNYEDSNTQETTDTVENTTDQNNKPVKPVEHVVNILLLGVEEIGGASNTDTMIVATMNTKNHTMKLTSLMRDIYVEIPGHDNNKLNAAYARGGIETLYQTIQNNFGVHLDGYVLVNFNAFEKIVDLLDGVEVTLTRTEANYLNRTNYISNPSYRTVKEGTQIMNGNQALGYCRVRKVPTETEHDDFGRTQRQRAVLNSIFEKVKKKNIVQLGLLMNDVLNDVDIQTDITNSEFNNYLEEAASLNVGELEQLRIPTDGNFGFDSVQIGKYKQSVVVPTSWDATRQEIHQFIYGNGSDDENSSDDTTDIE
ncbi:LCP family protein [Anaerocolumna sp. MB42-C2]|uniref:LCP family protein n=1 Tax=Anaerocolumna sp. MB42-C2 TaxID=3070997 RepID=UPI0027DF4882|nr:LCP family protein [Anaerocolumna sp. MB42-C2]WMJ87819.1 LCP family protein [Anaerocolumna sp. MB42-C2]